MDALFAQARTTSDATAAGLGAGVMIVWALYVIVGLVSLVCFIIVLVKMFQNDQVVPGILSIICCGLIAFVMGWQNATAWGIKNIMMVWTFVLLGQLVLAGVLAAMGGFAAAQMTP